MASHLDFVNYVVEQLEDAEPSAAVKCSGNMDFTVMKYFLLSSVTTSFL